MELNHPPKPLPPWLHDESKSSPLAGLPTGLCVVDSHLHLVNPLHQHKPDFTKVSKILGRPYGDIDEAQYKEAVEGSGVPVAAAVFVEVIPTSGSSHDEASWVLKMCGDPASLVGALVASVPVPSGEEATNAWLETMRARCGGSLPSPLRGARMQFPTGPAGDDAIGSDDFAAGLAALGAAGLHFEFCVHADRLPAVAAAVRRCGGATRVVLDHCGLNDSGQDFEDWKRDLAAIAACDNTYCKLSAIEEWQPRDGDPAPYLDHAIATFGADRCMFGGNWYHALSSKHQSKDARTACAPRPQRHPPGPCPFPLYLAGSCPSTLASPSSPRSSWSPPRCNVQARASVKSVPSSAAPQRAFTDSRWRVRPWAEHPPGLVFRHPLTHLDSKAVE